MKTKVKYSPTTIDEKLVRLAIKQLNKTHKSLVAAARLMKLERMRVEPVADAETEGGAA